MWFLTGLQHITDWEAYDHILFLVALCVMYTLKEWKSLLILITAFTLGHSLTLALGVLDILNIKPALVEFLIPLTIIATCIYNILNRNVPFTDNFKANYGMVLFFGLIHGLGFSSVLKSLLGSSSSILSPLFAFNIGIEAGQLLIVFAIMLFSLALTSLFRIQKSRFILFVSLGVFAIALILSVERFFELIR